MGKYIDEIFIYTDGGCKPNPGNMVGAFLITDGKNILKAPEAKVFGEGTNVMAEFKAIGWALDEATAYTRKKVHVHSDNEFAVKALNKDRRIMKRHLKPIVSDIYNKVRLFEEVNFTYVKEANPFIKKCDCECNRLFKDLGF